jgi:nucleoside-diphosphate-sugar epimerase
MRVVVAGGAGFLGSHMCRALLEQGHTVACIDSLITGQRSNLDDLIGRQGFEFHDADVTNPPRVPADLILHLASPASPVHYKRFGIETMMANSFGTQRLLDLARAEGARLVFASTSEVYGDPLVHPQTEEYWGNVNPIGTRACYDESKRFGEALTYEYRRQYGVNASIVRIFNTYGPNMNVNDGRVIPAFVGAALTGKPIPLHGDGAQSRSFCYVTDLIDGFIRVAMDASADGEVFNIGNPHEVTMRELAQLVARLVGCEFEVLSGEREAGDPARRRPDISKMRHRYGWDPKVPLEEGLQRTIDYFRGVLTPAGGKA